MIGRRLAYRRLGLIGDIHAEDALLEVALDTLQARGLDGIFSTGDIVDGSGSVDRCCELLASRGVTVVRGNHDQWFLTGALRELPGATRGDHVSVESKDRIARLPQTVDIRTVCGLALLCHGLGANDMARVGPEDAGYAIEANEDLQRLIAGDTYRWVLNGHSHRPMVRRFGRLTVINAGSLSPRGGACFFELDFEALSGSRFTFDALGRVGHPPEAFSLDERWVWR